jgi:hypothetical protein
MTVLLIVGGSYAAFVALGFWLQRRFPSLPAACVKWPR